MKKRILFIISDTGGGHRSAANAISAELGMDAECKMADLLRGSGLPGIRNAPEIYSYFSAGHIWLHNLLFRLSDSRFVMDLVSGLLYSMARPRIKKMVDEFGPDIVVVIHPLAVRPMCYHRDSTNAPWPVVTVVTDLVSVHASWITKEADLYLLPTCEAVEIAKNAGVSPDRIHLSGFPVHSRFLSTQPDRAAARQLLGIERNRFTVLITSGGAGGGRVKELVEELENECPECTLLVVTGRNAELRNRLSNRPAPNKNLRIYGFVDNMDLLMAACDIIVTKAGPGTIMEAATFARSLIITGAVGLQEAGNIDFVQSNNLGTYCPKRGDAGRESARLSSETRGVEKSVTNPEEKSQFAGTRNIAKILLELPGRTGKYPGPAG